MQRIECDDGALFLAEGWSSAPLSPISNDCLPRRSFTYCRLPHDIFLKLNILKLDGSSFDVQVVKKASVLELKQAVEEVFSRYPNEEDDNISWSLLWGHFCLCYKSDKLVNNKVSLRTFGVQDGDQLYFVRHISVNYSPVVKKEQRYQNTAFIGHPMASLSIQSNTFVLVVDISARTAHLNFVDRWLSLLNFCSNVAMSYSCNNFSMTCLNCQMWHVELRVVLEATGIDWVDLHNSLIC
ncbi:uncharacterized protein [Aristolochia californica]|uniref:uncharacterized protein isoform X2 n=1 Tax=Aristolochia californica TaxID=171875 RepID=UPI0035DC7655